ncbi:8297_t:CDS:2 [Gigaspora rosea]|nr:8297_t:CDS:2 [Gigaspora rosea]
MVNKKITPSLPTPSSKNSHVDTSLMLIQSAFTYQDIYNQTTAFALADSSSCTHLLLQASDLMKQKKWTEAKFLWVENLPSYTKLARTDQIDLFGGLLK